MSKQKTKKVVNKKNSQDRGVVRIIGGSMRGRKLHFSTVDGLRPTLDRIRETVFNWLARDIGQSQCLDLFSGSGALGFEAASRGAERVTMVENSAKVVNDLRSNAQILSCSNIQVIQSTAIQFLQENKARFDIVFLDPPFGKGMLAEIFDNIKEHLNPDAVIYVEQEKSASAYEPDADWNVIKLKRAGSFSYGLYQLKIS